MAEVLLISENYVKKYTTINGSVDPNLLYPSIYLAQDKWLLPFLGTDLLNKIKNDVANNTIAGNYQILLEDYIQKNVRAFYYLYIAKFVIKPQLNQQLMPPRIVNNHRVVAVFQGFCRNHFHTLSSTHVGHR